MFEKLKKIFLEKDEKKKNENLIAFLIILVVTLIFMNKILSSDSDQKEEMYENKSGVELVSKQEESAVLVENEEDDLAKSLEKILSKIKGVGNIEVLITYQKENPLKLEGAIVIAEGVRQFRNKEKCCFSSGSSNAGFLAMKYKFLR